jgi:hypothetical protein
MLTDRQNSIVDSILAHIPKAAHRRWHFNRDGSLRDDRNFCPLVAAAEEIDRDGVAKAETISYPWNPEIPKILGVPLDETVIMLMVQSADNMLRSELHHNIRNRMLQGLGLVEPATTR